MFRAVSTKKILYLKPEKLSRIIFVKIGFFADVLPTHTFRSQPNDLSYSHIWYLRQQNLFDISSRFDFVRKNKRRETAVFLPEFFRLRRCPESCFQVFFRFKYHLTLWRNSVVQ